MSLLGKKTTIKSTKIQGIITGQVEYLTHPNQYLICPYWDINNNKKEGLVQDDLYQGSGWYKKEQFNINEVKNGNK